jgi:5'-methylthioadenosine phosphorylase
MEGPQFSTRAESHLYRSWGGDIIGMTNLQEAKLAREAELCFATLAMVTDYDCWRSDEEEVEITDVLAVLGANADMAKQTVADLSRSFARERECRCRSALEHAIITEPRAIPERRRAELAVVAGRVLGGRS